MPSQYGPIAVNVNTGALEYAASSSEASAITDGTIVDADVNASAAIAASKLSGVVTTATVDAKGDLLAGTADNTVSRLAVGSNDQVLTADSSQATGIKWAAAAGGGLAATIFDAKGDLIAASAADTAARLAAGTNGQVLAADSAQATGLKWRTPPLVGTFPQTIDGRIANTSVASVGAVNRCQYMLVTEGPVADITSLVLRIGTSSGNIAVAVYSSTGTGRSRAPATRLATSGAVASPGTGERTISLGATVTVTPYETWFALSADNTSATFALLSVTSSIQSVGLAGFEAAHPPPSPAGAVSATGSVYWIAGV